VTFPEASSFREGREGKVIVRISREPAILALSIWLILTGLFGLVGGGFPGASVVLGVLAIVAGVLLLLAARPFGRASLGRILLALFLIGVGLMSLVGASGLGIIVGLLALVAGILMIWPLWRAFGSALGWLLLAIYLILVGLMFVLGLSFSGLGVIVAILALAAGILILLGR
jgi:hypothetical protein